MKEQYGMLEAQPLAMNNVMCLLIWTVAGITTSLVIAALEMVAKIISAKQSAQRSKSAWKK